LSGENALDNVREPQPDTLAKRLADIDPDQTGIPYGEWQAARLNAIFAEHGVLGEPGRITAETVQGGLEKQAKKPARRDAAKEIRNDRN
jgi:hypothetical protein